MRSRLSIVLLTAVMFGITAQGLAQVTTATLYGIVRDPAGAVIPKATITLTNEGTGAAKQATTDDAGEFVFTALPVGSYTLKIEKAGFKAYVSKQDRIGCHSKCARDAHS